MHFQTKRDLSILYQHTKNLYVMAQILNYDMPVSYTHLDVYKRQQEELQSNLPTGVVHWTGTVTAGKEIEIVIPHTDDFKTCSVEILAQRNSIWEKAIHGIDYNYAIVAVSYTHLDVYKRQVHVLYATSEMVSNEDLHSPVLFLSCDIFH